MSGNIHLTSAYTVGPQSSKFLTIISNKPLLKYESKEAKTATKHVIKDHAESTRLMCLFIC